MPLIPLSFVVAILLLVLLGVVVRSGEDGVTWAAYRNGLFPLLILLCAVQAFLSGLRWGYDIIDVMYVAPVTAALVPPLVYFGASDLVRKDGISAKARILTLAAPATLILLLVMTWKGAIDLVLPAIFIGYAGAVLNLTRVGPDALPGTPFETVSGVYHAIVFAACSLLLSAAMDLMVFLDFVDGRGEHAGALVATGNLMALLILSIASAAAVRGRQAAGTTNVASSPNEPDDENAMVIVRSLMEDKHLYRDPDLSLDRLARRAVVPSRRISAAINRATGKNVSQYVNEFRIAEACGLLKSSDGTVTEIMLAVGFQTKSNFNREFRRITGMSPVEWRQGHKDPA